MEIYAQVVDGATGLRIGPIVRLTHVGIDGALALALFTACMSVSVCGVDASHLLAVSLINGLHTVVDRRS